MGTQKDASPEQLVHAMFYEAPIMMFMVGSDYRVEAMNRVGSEFAGVTGKQSSGGLPPGEVLRCVQAMRVVDECGKGEACTGCVVRNTLKETMETGRAVKRRQGVMEILKDGRLLSVPVAISTSLVPLGESKPKVLLTVDDLTSLFEAKGNLKKTFAALARTQRKARLGSWEYDVTTGLVSFSREIMKIYGIRHEGSTLPIRVFYDRLHPEDRPDVEALVRSATKGRWKADHLFQYRARIGNGNERWMETQMESVPNGGGGWLVFGVTQDITDRKVTELALQDSEQRFRKLFESIQVGVVLVDANTRTVVDANPMALSMMLREREEVIGRQCHNFLCPSMEGECPVLDDGQPVENAERTLLDSKGRAVPVLKSVTAIDYFGRQILLESFLPIPGKKPRKLSVLNRKKT
jgi:PAS domain S-box-containing protein